MCVYCNAGDHFFKWDPPFPTPNPFVPAPLTPGPHTPWDLRRLRDLEDMLRRIKELEDRLGCPCEPNKADYLTLIRERIERLEKFADEKGAHP